MRVGRSRSTCFAVHGHSTRASRPTATSAPRSSHNLERHWNAATAGLLIVERAPRERCATLQLERLQRPVARLLDAHPGARRAPAAAGVRRARTSALASSTCARRAVHDKDDLRGHYPLGLLAVPREQLVRIHASSGTHGKPTVVAYTRGDLEIWTERDGALHGDGRRARRDGRPQRQRLRAVHRRARASTRARERLGATVVPRLGRLHRAPGDAAARPAAEVLVRHAVLRAGDRPGAERGTASTRASLRARASGCSAASRGPRRCGDQIERALGLAAAQLLRPVGDVGPGVAGECPAGATACMCRRTTSSSRSSIP